MNLQQPRPRRRPFTVSHFLPLALALAACGVARAQQAPNAPAQNPAATQTQAPPAGTHEQNGRGSVRLNVMVTDKAGRAVGDLRQEDFRVEEDGVPQTVTHFAREESPVSYALVVDNSGSLKGVLDYMLSAGGAFVTANKPGDETALVRFVGSDQISVVVDFTSDQAALVKGLASMYVEHGQTALIDAVYLSALRVAEQRADEAGRRRALVLLTDGEDRASHHRQSALQKLLRKLDVQVFVIGMVAALPEEGGLIRKSVRETAITFINGLARESGGRAFFPKNVREMQEAVGEIARDLRTQYAVSYQPSNPKHDGKFRKIQVKLNESAAGGKRTVHVRAGYVAPGGEKNESKEKSPRPVSP